MSALRFCLNDSWVEVSGVSPTTTLLRYLRDHASLTGTKEGCAEGDCGACSVVLVEENVHGKAVLRSVNSCLLLLPMVQGKRVYTVESVEHNGGAHPIQRAMAEHLGSQCGYCTPGIVMSLVEACHRDDLDAGWKLDSQMCGNLCRCTGYRPIREAARKVAGTKIPDRFQQALASPSPASMQLSYGAKDQEFYTPASMDELWIRLQQNPSARFVCGGTDLSLEVTKKFARPPKLISLEAIAELRRLTSTATGLSIGAAVNLTDLDDFVQERCVPLARMLRYFGSRLIKTRATVGGNLCNASPIGDLAPVFLSMGATIVAASRAGEREIPIDEFFIGYRKTALKPGEILARVELPNPSSTAKVAAYKVSKRRELDISAVSAGMYVDVNASGNVTVARLAFGGMAATPIRAREAENALLGNSWSAEAVLAAAEAVQRELKPLSDHRGSAWYRMTVAKNFIIGFFDETLDQRMPKTSDKPTATVEA